jgi:hypothetical protein
MLVSFGASWPVNIFKSYKSKSTKGKSVAFLYIVIVGYIAGIMHKILYSNDIVVVLYIINVVMVSIDVFMYYRNRRIEKAAGI